MRDFDKFNEDFDRQFKRTGRLVSVGFVVSALVSLALVAIVIWGIIELVGWVKTK